MTVAGIAASARYAITLARLAVFATVRRHDGTPHGFLSLPSVDVSKRAPGDHGRADGATRLRPRVSVTT